MKTVQVKMKSISPLLMHSYPLLPIESIEKKSREEQAELAAYRIPGKKELYIPGINIQRAMIAAAAFSKGKGRASLQKQTAACVSVLPEYVGLGTEQYVIDSRPVVIAATRGRILRHRPRLDEWEISFQIEWDENLIKESELRQIVDNCGKRVGFLEFRPEKKGPFGRAIVVSWG